jgi:hypothetical protein
MSKQPGYRCRRRGAFWSQTQGSLRLLAADGGSRGLLESTQTPLDVSNIDQPSLRGLALAAVALYPVELIGLTGGH